jgi:hypothetical protein
MFVRDTGKWRLPFVLPINLIILEHPVKEKPSIGLQLHFVKIKVWVVRARGNPTFVPNKVRASMALPLWPGLLVRIEYLLVKGRLRRAQRYVIQFKFRTLLCLSSSKPS